MFLAEMKVLKKDCKGEVECEKIYEIYYGSDYVF